MIKESALMPRLAEIGKIKTGGKGQTRQGKNGPYQLPVRYGHFMVTTTERQQDGNFKTDTDIMKKLGDKPQSIPIRLLFDDINLNLQTEFAMYFGKKKACCGDGEKANRIKTKQSPAGDTNEIPCPGTECEFFKENKCKCSARLFCTIPQSMELGGIHVFRTHSLNSVMSMMASLKYFEQNTNGILQGLPLKLKMVKKQTAEHGEIDFVTIVLDGLEMTEMRKSAVLELKNRLELGVDVKKYEDKIIQSGILIDHDEDEDVQEEYYPDKTEEKEEENTVINATYEDEKTSEEPPPITEQYESDGPGY